MIHPQAIVDPKAELADDVEVGPFCTIGPAVTIDSGTRIKAHVAIEGPTHIGKNNLFYPFSSIGMAPQDKKYVAEPTTMEIGDNNMIREFCTFNRGTVSGGGRTVLGSDNWIMAYVHLAHDCIVGNRTIFANNAQLAGHVEIADDVILGGFSMIHQFCRIGRHAFTGMGAAINRDVPPYVVAAGHMAHPRGINAEGLRRRGFDNDRIAAVKRAYRTLYGKGLTLEDATAAINQQAQDHPDVQLMADFLNAGSQRSLLR